MNGFLSEKSGCFSDRKIVRNRMQIVDAKIKRQYTTAEVVCSLSLSSRAPLRGITGGTGRVVCIVAQSGAQGGAGENGQNRE
jgi:hypothetical protein